MKSKMSREKRLSGKGIEPSPEYWSDVLPTPPLLIFSLLSWLSDQRPRTSSLTGEGLRKGFSVPSLTLYMTLYSIGNPMSSLLFEYWGVPRTVQLRVSSPPLTQHFSESLQWPHCHRGMSLPSLSDYSICDFGCIVKSFLKVFSEVLRGT